MAIMKYSGRGVTLLAGLACLFLFPSGAAPQSGRPGQAKRPDPEARELKLVSFVLDDVQKSWDRILPAQTKIPYHHAHLVLFRREYPSACGEARTAVGPFYCPGDEKVYLDLGFFTELRQKFGAPGEFAQAYVIAHEIGHHIQKLLGLEAKVRRLQERNPREANELSVRLELQADCFAGVWGNSTEQRNLINRTDINAAMRAAAAVGDDRLQRMGQGRVNPEKFTHGTSAQRVEWFTKGLDSGRISVCNSIQ